MLYIPEDDEDINVMITNADKFTKDDFIFVLIFGTKKWKC